MWFRKLQRSRKIPISNFERSIQYLAQNEGGFSNRSHDRGGATQFGITRGTLSRWRGGACSVADVQALEYAEAVEIYRQWYWIANSLDKVSRFPIACAVFDIGVVSGLTKSASLAQASVNMVQPGLTVDGHLGPKSIAALNVIPVSDFIQFYSAKVENNFRRIVKSDGTQWENLKGWVERSHRLIQLIHET